MSIEVTVYCTRDVPPLATFLASLSESVRDLCKGTTWDELVVGGVRASTRPGGTSAPGWPREYARAVVLSGRGGAAWPEVLFGFADTLADECGGAVVNESLDVIHRKLPDAENEAQRGRLEAQLEAALKGGKPDAVSKVFREIESLDEPELLMKASQSALANAATDPGLLDPLARLALAIDGEDDMLLAQLQEIDDAVHEGMHLADLIEKHAAAGGAISSACHRYVATQRAERQKARARECSKESRPPSTYRLARVTKGSMGVVAHQRIRASYAALRAILQDDGNAPDDMAVGDGGRVTTAWRVENAADPGAVFVIHDRQDEDDRSFSLGSFRERQGYEWYVAGPTEAAVSDVCRWLSESVLSWLRAAAARPALDDMARRNAEKLAKLSRSE